MQDLYEFAPKRKGPAILEDATSVLTYQMEGVWGIFQQTS